MECKDIAVYRHPTPEPEGWEANRNAVLERCCQYEDTGLTPEEIMDGKMLTGWIPVDERLPNSETIALAYIKIRDAVDDLGRIVLPKGVRCKVGISEGTPMEIFTSYEAIVPKKYDSENVLSDIVQNLLEVTEDMCVDLGPEKTGDIRRYIREIQKLLKQDN